MPWTYKDASRHNKAATGSKAHVWASVANSILKKSGDEAKAVKIANAAVKRIRR